MAGIRKDVIQTGYIPVEYNMYLEITEKAEKFDRMMGALKAYNEKHKRYSQARKKTLEEIAVESAAFAIAHDEEESSDFQKFIKGNGATDYIKLNFDDEDERR